MFCINLDLLKVGLCWGRLSHAGDESKAFAEGLVFVSHTNNDFIINQIRWCCLKLCE